MANLPADHPYVEKYNRADAVICCGRGAWEMPETTERLEQINPALAQETRKVLNINKSERHIRGGLATKEKYLHK